MDRVFALGHIPLFLRREDLVALQATGQVAAVGIKEARIVLETSDLAAEDLDCRLAMCYVGRLPIRQVCAPSAHGPGRHVRQFRVRRHA